MATKTNLESALSCVGARMNRDEDVLVLLITSHGGSEGISLEGPQQPSGLEEKVLTPRDLRDMLNVAGIKWRVLIVAGCHSGVFMPFFRDVSTMIVTAASSDRPSYGCAAGRETTKLGQASFGESLTHERYWPKAFEDAFALVNRRETLFHQVHSEPQMWVGPEIDTKLHLLAGH